VRCTFPGDCKYINTFLWFRLDCKLPAQLRSPDTGVSAWRVASGYGFSHHLLPGPLAWEPPYVAATLEQPLPVAFIFRFFHSWFCGTSLRIIDFNLKLELSSWQDSTGIRTPELSALNVMCCVDGLLPLHQMSVVVSVRYLFPQHDAAKCGRWGSDNVVVLLIMIIEVASGHPHTLGYFYIYL